MRSRFSSLRISRRKAAALLGAAPLLAQVTQKTPPPSAQAPAPPIGVPAPAAPGTTPQQKMQKALADVHQLSDRLAQIEVPMDVEPAFAFRP